MSEEMKTIEKKPVRRRAVKKTEPAEQEIISAGTDSEEPAAEEPEAVEEAVEPGEQAQEPKEE